MNISTKFDKGEKVYFIDNDRVVVFPVNWIVTTNGRIEYSFITRKSTTLMDKDTVVYVSEDDCFKSIKELAEYYERKLNG